MTDKQKARLAVVGFGLLLAVVYANPLFVKRNFAGRDLIPYNLPMEKAIHDAYARGHFPVWLPYVSGGRPLLPNPNAGALYPLRILLSPISFPMEMRLYPLIHWLAAGIGMIVLLRALGGSLAAAWMGAVTYVFSGVVVSEVFLPHYEPGMALLPWIVWTVRRGLTGRPTGLILLSILFGLDMLAGEVFTIGLGILCAFLWILLESPREAWLRSAAQVVVALGLGGLIASPAILASVLWAPETNRGVLGMRLGEALFYSITPWRLLEFVVPYPFGPAWDLSDNGLWTWAVLQRKFVGLFMTLYAGSFAAIAALVRWRERRPGLRFGRVLLVLALAASVFPSLILDRLGNVSSPLPLRNPEKLAVAVAFALALLGGLWLDRLRLGQRPGRWTLLVGVVLAAAALSARLSPIASGKTAIAVTGAGNRYREAASRDLPRSLSEAGLFWMASLVAIDLLASSTRRTRQAVALSVLTLVPILSNRRIAQTFREEEIFSPPLFVRFLRRRDPAGDFRTLGESMYRESGRIEFQQTAQDPGFVEYFHNNWYQHTQALWERGTVLNADFDAGDLARMEALRRLSGQAVRFKDSQNFFANLSLRWGVRYRDQAPVTGYRPFGGNPVRAWDELPEALPDIRLVERWREEAGSLEALRQLPSLGLGEIVVEAAKPSSGTARGGSVRVLERQPERLRLETRSLDPTWLFVLRDYWNWRTVTLDGREVDVYPAQLAFSAIRVPAGIHQVDWRERFPGLAVAGFGPVLFLLIAGLLLTRERRARKFSDRETSLA
ncbi:MAG TPA: hypothetical protein VKJ00_07760 [Thermoanaerobaculia bacterium]|nr:hypothetical protein [Thermoanaerobaculia bacterium]